MKTDTNLVLHVVITIVLVPVLAKFFCFSNSFVLDLEATPVVPELITHYSIATVVTRAPFHKHCINLIPTWINNYMISKVWDEITYPFQNFNGATVQVWEWIGNSQSNFTGHVITYPCWD